MDLRSWVSDLFSFRFYLLLFALMLSSSHLSLEFVGHCICFEVVTFDIIFAYFNVIAELLLKTICLRRYLLYA